MHTFTIYTQDECKTQSVVYIYTYAYIIIIFTHLIIIHTHIIMHTITTYTQDECKTQSVVYISPAHCGYVQVLPTQTEVVEFPPPYQYLPKLVFPYPTQWNPYPGTSVDTPKKKKPLKKHWELYTCDISYDFVSLYPTQVIPLSRYARGLNKHSKNKKDWELYTWHISPLHFPVSRSVVPLPG